VIFKAEGTAVEVEELKLPEGYLVVRATEERLEIVDPMNSDFGIFGSLYRGTLKFKIAVENLETGERSRTLQGWRLFKAMMDWFGNGVENIRTEWLDGTNWKQFTEATQRGLSPEEAATKTWSGGQCISFGYRKPINGVVVGDRANCRWSLIQFLWIREEKSS
jgi:hypothetical protein